MAELVLSLLHDDLDGNVTPRSVKIEGWSAAPGDVCRDTIDKGESAYGNERLRVSRGSGGIDGMRRRGEVPVGFEFVPGPPVTDEFTVKSSLSSWLWRRQVADAVAVEAAKQPRAIRKAFEKRVLAFRECGEWITVDRCNDCGERQPGSGRFSAKKRCNWRSCPTCVLTRSRYYGQILEAAGGEFAVEGYGWFSIGFEVPRSYGRDSMQVEGFQKRAIVARHAARDLWRFLSGKERKSKGFLYSVECSPYGKVHVHAIYYGPPITAGKIESRLAASDCQGVFVRKIEASTPVELRKKLERQARYTKKGIATKQRHQMLEESWIGGDCESPVTVPDPILVARWEVATYRLRLTELCGSLRGFAKKLKKKPGDETPVEPVPEPCVKCGSLDQSPARARTEPWIRACHRNGMPGLRRTAAWRAIDGPTVPRLPKQNRKRRRRWQPGAS